MHSTVNPSRTLSEEERQAVRTVLQLLEPFRSARQGKERATMPLQYLMMFLMVAEDEGLGVTEYATRAGVAQSVATRHLLDIGDRDRYREPGMGLVTSRMDPMNYSRRQQLLTPKGQAMVRQLKRALDTYCRTLAKAGA